MHELAWPIHQWFFPSVAMNERTREDLLDSPATVIEFSISMGPDWRRLRGGD